MKKKILILLSVLTIFTFMSSIALAGEIDPAPIREVDEPNAVITPTVKF